MAAYKGETECVTLLLSGESSINDVDAEFGETVLHMAAHSGHSEVVIQLCRREDSNIEIDVDGVTPYLLAIESGHMEVAKIIYKSMMQRKGEWRAAVDVVLKKKARAN
jgi:ankyrin repeat protein